MRRKSLSSSSRVGGKEDPLATDLLTAMPSRSRSPSAVSSSQEPQPKRPYQPVVYDPNFADEGLDLTLRTLDGISFSLLRSTLAIHLPTFAAMLPPPPSAAALLSPQQLLPTTTPSSSSRARSVGEVDDLNGSTSQLVDLHELSVPFGLLLRYAIPGKYLDLEGNPPKFPSYRFFAEIGTPPALRSSRRTAQCSPPTSLSPRPFLRPVVLENTLELAHRYQLPLVFDVISKIQLASEFGVRKTGMGERGRAELTPSPRFLRPLLACSPQPNKPTPRIRHRCKVQSTRGRKRVH